MSAGLTPDIPEIRVSHDLPSVDEDKIIDSIQLDVSTASLEEIQKAVSAIPSEKGREKWVNTKPEGARGKTRLALVIEAHQKSPKLDIIKQFMTWGADPNIGDDD